MTNLTDTRTSDVEPRTDDQIVEEFLERHNYFDPLDVDPDTRADARWLRSTLAAVREEERSKERNYWVNSLEDVVRRRIDQTFGEGTSLGAFLSAIKEGKTPEEVEEVKEIVRSMEDAGILESPNQDTK